MDGFCSFGYIITPPWGQHKCFNSRPLSDIFSCVMNKEILLEKKKNTSFHICCTRITKLQLLNLRIPNSDPFFGDTWDRLKQHSSGPRSVGLLQTTSP